MDNNKNEGKLGFWSLLCIAISAQLGASIFLLPTELARFRTLGILGWMIGGIGAIFITSVFSFLCSQTEKTGGPHIYARMFFGETVGFFATWIFWCGAWACNPILIATAINYLMAVVGDMSMPMKLTCEILMVLTLTWINVLGLKTTGTVEVILTILKVTPLILIPLFAFPHLNMGNFKEMMPADLSAFATIIKATILSFWGFVGLEGGTSSAKSVVNPRKTIPMAIVLGTSFVAIISLINTVSVFGIIPPEKLEIVGAPFSQVLITLFGGSSDKFIGLLTFVMCYGSLNAWVFFSGQIAKTAADENMFPISFKKLNTYGAPAYGLWVSAIGTIIILFLQKSPFFGDKIGKFLDMSVVIYVLLYTMAVFAYMKFIWQAKIRSAFQITITMLALCFCLFILLESDLLSFAAVGLMLLAGLPIYFKLKKEGRFSKRKPETTNKRGMA